MTVTLKFQIGTHIAGTRMNAVPRNDKTITVTSPKTGVEFILPKWFVTEDAS